MQLNSHCQVIFLKGRWPATESSWMTVNHSLAVSRISPTFVAGQLGLAGTGTTSGVHKQSSLGVEKSRGGWRRLLSWLEKQWFPPLQGLLGHQTSEALWDIFQCLDQQKVSGLLLTGLRETASEPQSRIALKRKIVRHSLFVTWGFSNA